MPHTIPTSKTRSKNLSSCILPLLSAHIFFQTKARYYFEQVCEIALLDFFQLSLDSHARSNLYFCLNFSLCPREVLNNGLGRRSCGRSWSEASLHSGWIPSMVQIQGRAFVSQGYFLQLLCLEICIRQI